MNEQIAGQVQAGLSRVHPRVRRTQDLAEIAGLLERQRIYAASVFPYVEPRVFSRTRWHVAEGGGIHALILQLEGATGASLYLQGDPEGIEAIWDRLQPPRRSYVTFRDQHRAVIQRHFLLRGLQPLVRMQVDEPNFRPAPSQAVPLAPHDLAAVNDLYRSDSGALLSRQQLAEGAYFGLWEGRKLVSIAGTQMISQLAGIAMVANVLTHPGYRGRGYATQCVSALTAALWTRVHDVVLNVDPENGPALRVYRRLGYREAFPLAEAWAIWKGQTIVDRVIAGFFDCFSR